MKDRPRLEIRPVLSAWNFMLAAFRLVNSLHSDLVLMAQLEKPSDNVKKLISIGHLISGSGQRNLFHLVNLVVSNYKLGPQMRSL